jgi:ribonuclease D
MTVYFDMPPGYSKQLWPDSAQQSYDWNAQYSYGASGSSSSGMTTPRSFWADASQRPQHWVPSYDAWKDAYGSSAKDSWGAAAKGSWKDAASSSWGDYQSAEIADEPDGVFVINSTSSGAFASLEADASTADVVAIDAEWVPDFDLDSDNPIAVLQLAFIASRRVYVIQLGPMGRKLPQAVQMMLVNPEVTKVGFAVSQKDTVKFRSSGIAVTHSSILDIQHRCAALSGCDWSASNTYSLKRAAHDVLGYDLPKDKRCACSDWSVDKLTAEQVRYAALDAWVALRLYYAVA